MEMTRSKSESIQEGVTDLQTTPPEFGHALHKFWLFDPDYINLNHGSYGSVPRPVMSACEALSARIEANPDLFYRLEYLPLLVAVRDRLARLIGAQTDECVMVPNTSHGINTVLRNFEWNEGDVLIANNTTYDSISSTMRYLSERPPYPILSQFTLAFPTSHAAILSQFREHLRLIKQTPSLAGALPTSGIAIPSSPDRLAERKIVAVFDSIASNPGVLMPWKEMVRICREEGVWSVVDAAHSVGQEVGIDLGKADPDFWVSNCHKWLYSKRPSAILYVPKRNQYLIRSTIPTSLYYTSRSSGNVSFLKQFEWTGTVDYTHDLSVAAALDFRAYLGGEEKINAYCHALALSGGKRLAEVMGTRVMESVPEEDEEDELTLNMVNVELPLPAHIKPTFKVDMLLNQKLLFDHKVYAAHYYHAGRWWTRASAQVWNEVEDFDKLGRAFLIVCAEIAATPRINEDEDI